jgi:hypothetical protein
MKMKLDERIQENVIGVDLGQARDYTAISILEQRQKFRTAPFQGQKEGDPFYHVTFLERIKLNTPYPEQIKRVREVFNSILKQRGIEPTLVLDATGCGRPIYDEFKAAGFRPKGILIHGGDSVTRDGDLFNVPKRDLAGVLQILYQQGRIKVSSKLPEAKTLTKELLNFKVKINIQTGHDSYEAWRGSEHDDLVLSVACAAWWCEKYRGRGNIGFVHVKGLEICPVRER